MSCLIDSGGSFMGVRPSTRSVRTVVAVVGVAAAGTVIVASSHAAAVATPAFVSQASTHKINVTSAAVTLPSPASSGDRLVVETGVWSPASATAKTVTDSAGDAFTEVLHFTAADHTEMTVWTAPV